MLAVLDFPYSAFSPSLISAHLADGEPRRDKLMLSHITPNQHHFVRNHGGIPTLVDEAAYRLEVGGLVARPGSISLAELKDETLFQQVEMTVTLQCSGTRRIEQIDYAPGEGDEMINAPWAEGAIGTAVYRGVKLTKLLKHFGGVIEPGQHIEATGCVRPRSPALTRQRRHVLQEEQRVELQGQRRPAPRQTQRSHRRVGGALARPMPADQADEWRAAAAHPWRTASPDRARGHRRSQLQVAASSHCARGSVHGARSAARCAGPMLHV